MDETKNQMREETNGSSESPSAGTGQNENAPKDKNDLLEAPKSPSGEAPLGETPLAMDIGTGPGKADDKTEQLVEESKMGETPGMQETVAKDVDSEVIPNFESELAVSAPQTNVSRLEIDIGNKSNGENSQELSGEVACGLESNTKVEGDTEKEISKQTEVEQSSPTYTSTEELQMSQPNTPHETVFPDEGATAMKDNEGEKVLKEFIYPQDRSMDIAETSGTDSPMSGVPSLPDDAGSGPHTPTAKEDEHFLDGATEESQQNANVISESAKAIETLPQLVGEQTMSFEKGTESFSAPQADPFEVEYKKPGSLEGDKSLPKESLTTEVENIAHADATFTPLTDSSIKSAQSGEHPAGTAQATPMGTDESLDTSTMTPQQDVTDEQLTSHDISEASSAHVPVSSADSRNQMQSSETVDALLVDAGDSKELPAEDPQPAFTDDLIALGNDEATPSNSKEVQPEVISPVTPDQPSASSLADDFGEQSKPGNSEEIVDIGKPETPPVEKIKAIPDVLPDPIVVESKPEEKNTVMIEKSKEPSHAEDVDVVEFMDEASPDTSSMEAPLLRERRNKKDPLHKEEAAAETNEPVAVITTATDFEEPRNMQQDEKAPLMKTTDEGKTYGTSEREADGASKRSESSGVLFRIRTLVNAYCNIL